MNISKPQLSREEFLFETNGYHAQVCQSLESKKLAYQLRYQSYHSAQMIEPNPEEILSDINDFRPNSRTYLIWYDGLPVATVRSSVWSPSYDWELTEGVNTFRKEINNHIGLDRRILESSRYAIAPHFKGRKSLFAQLLLFRIQDLTAHFEDCAHIITSVRENHVPFYERMLGFKRISESTGYSWVKVKFVLLTTLQEESRQTAISRGMPECTAEERERYALLLNTSMPITYAATA